ncbi:MULTISPECIES: glycosyltransferase [unclassified Leptolyngbya]|uniref:glycosyltransferase n=1 Tax=unclassified Leptolyngbya TaxID=2650499 RepID=UPI00168833B2|nr:glycosyltransferase [Leptolyngbya sp. FACHB-16]MBD1911730.1 glycosyltransferase [Leptolyngbya sp. FACHB-8]MBD2157329.1 glycosyltransferase [Leptolyngbya sp. FACHB-16]
MVHFGIICPPYPGHLNPQTALGRELQSRGHRVTVLQISDVEPLVRSEGVGFHAIGQSTYQPGSLAQTFVQLARLSEIEALQYSVKFCREVTEIICRDAPAAIAQLGIDALLVDQLEPAGETVAEGLGLPFICVSCGQAIHRRADIPPFFMPWNYEDQWWARLRNQVAYTILDRNCRPILQVINEYRDRWNLPPYRQMYRSNTRLLHMSQQVAAFDLPNPNLPDYFHYVGPLRNRSPRSVSFPSDRLTGQPLIYASLGSVQNRKYEIFHQIATACEGLDVQLVMPHGGGMDAAQIASLPGNPLVVEYAPQREVLSRASLTITHGGMNTVLDSLSYGVPLVAIPITFEQPGTGARIRWTGVGEVIPLTKLTPPRLREAIQQVSDSPTYAANAARVQQAIQQAGGVQRAADLIEQVVQRESTGKSSFASSLRQ